MELYEMRVIEAGLKKVDEMVSSFDSSGWIGSFSQ
jgi:hypothetical protein